MRLPPSFRTRRGLLALGLCLLAALFALEAKIAWYGPAHGVGVDVSSQKALPADLPALVSHGGSSQLPETLLLASLLLMSIGAIAGNAKDFSSRIDVDFPHIPVASAPCFAIALFFRPPPAL